jgi:hypothetical protein
MPRNVTQVIGRENAVLTGYAWIIKQSR